MPMEYDKHLLCVECRQSFCFSISEQNFFAARGLTNEPRRCHCCRVVVRAARLGLDATVATAAVSCAQCGVATRVPFQPRGHKPILCFACLQEKRHSELSISAI